MPNIRMTIEYDGAHFHGWQTQPGLRTVQSELQRVLEMVLRQKIDYVLAAGRTDCGVHARGQVVNFHLPAIPDLRRLKYSVSNILKGELAVLGIDVVEDSFHATRCARRKQYSYYIINREVPLVLDYGKAWHVSYTLDREKMIETAECLLGKHDFSSFRGAACNARTPVKEIFASKILIDGQNIIYRVIGSGFLKQMVRTIVGTIVDIGRGRLTNMQEILQARSRVVAGVTAPPQGLFLDWVEY